MSKDLQKALKILNVIDQGQSNVKLQSKMKLKALIKSDDSHKVRHLATRYASSVPIHSESKFYKEITAPEDEDLEIIIESHTSKKFI